MAENSPAKRQRQSLSQRKDGTVCRLLQHEKCLEELMKRMRRIGQTEMAQRIGYQQIAEVIGDTWRRHGILRKERQPKRDGQDAQQEHAPAGLFGEPAAVRLE